MSNSYDTFESLVNQLRTTEQPIKAMRHYLSSIPEEDAHHSLFDILLVKLESEFKELELLALKTTS